MQDYRSFPDDSFEVSQSSGKVFIIEPFGNNIPNYISSLDISPLDREEGPVGPDEVSQT